MEEKNSQLEKKNIEYRKDIKRQQHAIQHLKDKNKRVLSLLEQEKLRSEKERKNTKTKQLHGFQGLYCWDSPMVTRESHMNMSSGGTKADHTNPPDLEFTNFESSHQEMHEESHEKQTQQHVNGSVALLTDQGCQTNRNNLYGPTLLESELSVVQLFVEQLEVLKAKKTWTISSLGNQYKFNLC